MSDTTPLSTQIDDGYEEAGAGTDEAMSEAEVLEREHSPNDKPMAVDEYGTTAEEQWRGEPLDLRLSREEPDLSEAPLDDVPVREAGIIVEPDAGLGPDEESEAIGIEIPGHTGTRSAEEAAMHVIEP